MTRFIQAAASPLQPHFLRRRMGRFVARLQMEAMESRWLCAADLPTSMSMDLADVLHGQAPVFSAYVESFEKSDLDEKSTEIVTGETDVELEATEGPEPESDAASKPEGEGVASELELESGPESEQDELPTDANQVTGIQCKVPSPDEPEHFGTKPFEPEPSGTEVIRGTLVFVNVARIVECSSLESQWNNLSTTSVPPRSSFDFMEQVTGTWDGVSYGGRNGGPFPHDGKGSTDPVTSNRGPETDSKVVLDSPYLEIQADDQEVRIDVEAGPKIPRIDWGSASVFVNVGSIVDETPPASPLNVRNRTSLSSTPLARTRGYGSRLDTSPRAAQDVARYFAGPLTQAVSQDEFQVLEGTGGRGTVVPKFPVTPRSVRSVPASVEPVEPSIPPSGGAEIGDVVVTISSDGVDEVTARELAEARTTDVSPPIPLNPLADRELVGEWLFEGAGDANSDTSSERWGDPIWVGCLLPVVADVLIRRSEKSKKVSRPLGSQHHRTRDWEDGDGSTERESH